MQTNYVNEKLFKILCRIMNLDYCSEESEQIFEIFEELRVIGSELVVVISKEIITDHPFDQILLAVNELATSLNPTHCKLLFSGIDC